MCVLELICIYYQRLQLITCNWEREYYRTLWYLSLKRLRRVCLHGQGTAPGMSFRRPLLIFTVLIVFLISYEGYKITRHVDQRELYQIHSRDFLPSFIATTTVTLTLGHTSDDKVFSTNQSLVFNNITTQEIVKKRWSVSQIIEWICYFKSSGWNNCRTPFISGTSVVGNWQ